MTGKIERALNTSLVEEPSQKKYEGKKVAGISLVALGIVMVVLAAVAAAGLFEKIGLSGSNMYFVAAGLTVGALIPLLLGAYLLSSRIPKNRTIGNLVLE